ncbi:hypothetical protein Tcan_15081 [Toxocara canis]|uniref:CRIB domain-containing protein n=1 Tax=Toxocara canis TaxID=6265 RepID=A0A0B2VE14_TOXCA|nr:hypothetical protein Tcan_15081 [Toxocara canis]
MIGRPTDFRHIGHMGVNDLNSSCNVEAVSCLLRSKGDDVHSLPVPHHLRANDIPIRGVLILDHSQNIRKLQPRKELATRFSVIASR